MKSFKHSPYVVGVTGHMDLRDGEIAPLKQRITTFFEFLLTGRDHGGNTETFENFTKLLGFDPSTPENAARLQAVMAGLNHWPQFQQTPLVVLTSLAPGADTLVAEVALAMRDKNLPIHVIAPLPFDHDLYGEATTFRDADDTVAAEKKQKYRDLVNKIGVENTFCVRLDEDLDLSDEQFHTKQIEDRDSTDATRRYVRYYAAGEYIAKYSHWLLAIWDHNHDANTSAGTAAIIHSRRSGSRFRVLPSSQGLNLPNSGPTLQLYTHRKKNASPAIDFPAARLLYSEASEPRDPALPNRDAIWHLNALSVTTKIARNLEEFNREKTLTNGELQGELDSVMQFSIGSEKIDLASFIAPEALDRFRAIARTRKRATKANYPLNDKSVSTLAWMFWLALLAAFLVHLFSEWHPQETSHDRAHDKTAYHIDLQGSSGELLSDTGLSGTGALDEKNAEPAQDESEPPQHPTADSTSQLTAKAGASQANVTVNVYLTPPPDKAHHQSDEHRHGPGPHNDHHLDLRRVLFGSFGCLAAFSAIAIFWWRRAQNLREKAHDYRAIAEGLRVQMFWNLAGLGKSVPANYMHRQRGELDWIRGVIRTASMPYEEWRGFFSKLSPKKQVLSLRCVLHNWVDKQDRVYYHPKIRQHHYIMHSWHKLGSWLALAGVCGFVLMTISSGFDSHEPFKWLQQHVWLGLPIAVIFVLTTLIWILYRQAVEHRNVLNPAHHDPQLTPKTILQRVTVKLFRFVDTIVPTTDSHPTQYYPPGQEKWRMAVNFLSYLLPALVLMTLVACLGAIIANVWTTSPNATIWSSILFGVLLVSGALCVAWTEKKLDSEFAYQYSTMGPLFYSASLRLQPLVERMSALADTIEGGATDQEDARSEFAEKLEETRSVLFELGLEALDENAEWLILHRARPLEPVMAG